MCYTDCIGKRGAGSIIPALRPDKPPRHATPRTGSARLSIHKRLEKKKKKLLANAKVQPGPQHSTECFNFVLCSRHRQMNGTPGLFIGPSVGKRNRTHSPGTQATPGTSASGSRGESLLSGDSPAGPAEVRGFAKHRGPPHSATQCAAKQEKLGREEAAAMHLSGRPSPGRPSVSLPLMPLRPAPPPPP